MSGVRGYKVFNSDWTCTPIIGVCKQYTCPGMFEEDVELDICHAGMHFCKRAVDCFNYYQFDTRNKVAEVIAHGDVVEKENKCCTNKLEIIREIPWSELLEIVNTGNCCTGLGNSGNFNIGNHNSGKRNIFDYNSGNGNSGNYNSGDYNSGNCNSGDYNSGNGNSGDWNQCNFSNGCFNTIEPKINMFNKQSDWTYFDWCESNARFILDMMPRDGLWYVCFEDMTEEELEQHPESKTTGGYLKREHYTDQDRQSWWELLSETYKNEILDLPNFDAEIFKKITGINVNQ